MRTLQYAVAIAVGLSSGLLASIASAQDSETLKSFRDKSMIKIEYKAPSDKQLEPIYQRLKSREVLERLQAFLSPLRLPQPVNVVTAQCGGQIELPYQLDAPVTICYEYIGLIEQAAPSAIGTVGQAVVTRDIALVGPFVQFSLRSVARHLIDMLELPVWGNAEDAADSLAAFIMLEVSPQVAQKTIFGTAYFFAKTGQTEKLDLGAIRPHIAQRYFNLLCIAVGSDLVRYSVFLPIDRQEGPVDLPKNRYGHCLQLAAPERSEYSQIKYAFHQLIRDKYVDLPLLKQVRTIEWLADD
jgi:Putative metallopeptidase